MSYNELYEKELAFQADRRRATVEFIRLISDLWYEDTIELILFRNQLIDRNVSEILNLVEYASEFVEKPISIFDAVEIAREIKDQGFPPSKIDIGKLVSNRFGRSISRSVIHHNSPKMGESHL